MKKIICIPYAGGNADFFSGFLRLMPHDMEKCTVEYAGHGKRYKEPYYGSFGEMTEDVACQINGMASCGDELYLFGYSMGSIVLYELLARKLLWCTPCGVILASHEAPDREWESKRFHQFTDEHFFMEMKRMGGFEKCGVEMLKNRFFRKLHFEPLLHDYRLLGEYQMSRRIEFSMPALLFYSEQDIPTEDILHWEPFLGKKGSIVEIGGNHFMLADYTKEMAEEVRGFFGK